MKFLHISDIHINKSFATKDERLSKALKKKLKRSFFNAIDYCIKEDLDALVIAGDLFDHYPIEFESKIWVLEAFEKLKKANVAVLYASGNHDYTSVSSDLITMDFPSNVKTFFDEQYQVHTLTSKSQGKSYNFIGCGHRVAHEKRPLIHDFPKGDYIGIGHTLVASSLVVNEKSYLPSELEVLKNLNYRYFALGHVHQRGPLDVKESLCYSGSLMGLNRNETGPKGGYLIKVDDQGIEKEFVALSALTYEDFYFDISDYSHLENAFDGLMQKLKDTFAERVLEDFFVSIYLKGQSSLYTKLREEKLLKQFEILILEHLDFIDVKVINQTKTLYDAGAYKQEKSVLGAVLFALDDLKESLDVQGLNLLNRYDEKSLNRLLDNMEEELMSYFLEGYDEN